MNGSILINKNNLIIAYEPVWAIGSGKTPNPEEINSVHEMIKDVVQSRFPKIGLESVLYGGSVNFKNASSLFEQKNVDGALIGGASLDGKEFDVKVLSPDSPDFNIGKAIKIPFNGSIAPIKVLAKRKIISRS